MKVAERFVAHLVSLEQLIGRFYSSNGAAQNNRATWLGYAIAVLGVAIATLGRVLFYYAGAQLPYLCFYPVVVLVSLFFGLGPGMLSVALSVISTMFWFEPVGQFSIAITSDKVSLTLFTATAVLIVWICEHLRRALYRAKIAEEALRISHRKETSELLENISDGFVSLDREWRFLYVNSAGCRLLHMPRDALLGRIAWDMFPHLEDSAFGRAYRRSMEENTMIRVEDFYPEPLNAWFDARCYPSANGLSIFFEDLTEQKKAREALHREQEFSRVLVENMVDAVVACDENFHLNLLNRSARKWHGAEDLNIPAEHWAEFFHLYCADGITPMTLENLPLTRAFGGETLYDIPMVIRANGQPPRHAIANGGPFFDEKGRKLGAVIVIHDITERKLAEEELYRLNRLYAVLSQVNQAVIRCNSRDELFRKICEVTVEFGAFKMAWLGQIDPATQRVVPIAISGDNNHYLDQIQVYADNRPEGNGPVGKSIRLRKACISNDFPHDPDTLPWRHAADAVGFRACISLPIQMHGEVFGVLAVYAGESNYFHDKEIRLLEEVASDVSFALDHLDQELRRQQDEIALKQAKEAAEAASRAKDQFIAILSHELRTPLTPVLTAVALIQASKPWAEDAREEIEMIHRNVELEAKLIDDLLDITRISRGLIELHPEEVDAHACLKKAVETCHAEMAAKGIQFSAAMDASNSHVWADPARLQQVFWNLLKNAVKFTPEGGRITIHTANDGSRIKIEVADTGIGIEPEILPRIYNAFEQGEQTRSRRFGGLGLGLCIAKNVMELHHGRLTAQSEGPNRGAVFTVEMETMLLENQKIPAAAATLSPRESGPPLRILLVEDHPDTLQMLSRLLQKWGYQVRTANGVAQALALAAREPFGILISDIGLPDGNGLDIMRKAKAHYGLRGIALSGFGTEEDLRQSREAGFEEHLTKPVGVEALRAAVERLAATAIP